ARSPAVDSSARRTAGWLCPTSAVQPGPAVPACAKAGAWLATATRIKAATMAASFRPPARIPPMPPLVHITCRNLAELKGLLAKLPQHKRLLATCASDVTHTTLLL